MTLEAMRPFATPPVEAPARPGVRAIAIEVVNATNLQEATIRRVVTPQIEIDHDEKRVRFVSQGLSLTEEKRTEGEAAVIIELAARYRRGEGAIRQCYRFLVFENAAERDGLGNVYAVRLPMGAWAPTDPDICLEWLGRGGHQQGDFVLLPRTGLPAEATEVPRPRKRKFWEMAADHFRRVLAETVGDGDHNLDEWTRLIGRHDPQDAQLFRKDNRLFVVALSDTVVLHPEHAPMALPAGHYEVVEDRATSYWRKAID